MNQDIRAVLNAPTPGERLAALRALPPPSVPVSDVYVNNHIHTIYSFSPYSPTLAAYRAREAGLATAGIMDHDTLIGAEEFAEAGRILGVATTQGVECRVSLAGTPFAERRVNNPDQVGNIYVSMHGVPRCGLATAEAFLSPIRAARDRRNQAMCTRLSALMAPLGAAIDYERDVCSLSQQASGGTVTERHLCFAAARALIAARGKGERLIAALAELEIVPSLKITALLSDEDNPYYEYDLLGLFKSALAPRFYLPATDECPPVEDFIEACRNAGAIATYPYLGDVVDSVTGDKAAQCFEDAFLDELFNYLKHTGFQAITYMPTRNTPAQLERVQRLCGAYGFFEISGEDINSPRQSFLCPALKQPEFAHLRASAWALIGHERAAASDIQCGMFSEESIARYPELSERIAAFAETGMIACAYKSGSLT